MKTSQFLGDFSIHLHLFAKEELAALFLKFKEPRFKELSEWQRSDLVNRALLGLIQRETGPCFLLAAVLGFIEKIEKESILHHYTFNSFELWLNQFSSLSREENYFIRAKIVGKLVPRSDYRLFFPIGTGRTYEGSHFVTAHRSPDLDTTIASFWGWVDAFAARVGSGLHVWNVPGGPPASQIEIDLLFRDFFGPAVITHLVKTRTSLALTCQDLLTQERFQCKKGSDLSSALDPDFEDHSVVITDEDGFYLGDWRSVDAENVRQATALLGSCLQWFDNYLQGRMISLLAQPIVTQNHFAAFLSEAFTMEIGSCEPALAFSAKQKREAKDLLVKVLGMSSGLNCTFGQIGLEFSRRGLIEFTGVEALIASLNREGVFDAKGSLVKERPPIFQALERTMHQLREVSAQIRAYLERFDTALSVKTIVFGQHPNFVTIRADLDEARIKIGQSPHLAVVSPEKEKFVPIGTIRASDIRKNILGTVSVRDFSNREEMGIPAYLDVISIIDHHKTSLSTFSPPLSVICDVQSCNTLVAERSIQINDWMRERPQSGSVNFYVHPHREFVEYLHFLYGILDDTDLLSKATVSDVEVMASLLNRLKSLAMGRETRIVQFNDIARDEKFVKRAAERLLRNEEMYSLYRKVYHHREKEIERNLALCAERKASNLFADTKEQNGCCRVGQTKLFSANFDHFQTHAAEVRRHWLELAQKTWKESPEIDLHLHMISTVVGAEEVFRGTQGQYAHRDELWLWASPKEAGTEHLRDFLSAFQSSPGLKDNRLDVEFLGENADELSQLFRESFLAIPHILPEKPDSSLPIAILRYEAGSLNSRKAMVSPFLPLLP